MSQVLHIYVAYPASLIREAQVSDTAARFVFTVSDIAWDVGRTSLFAGIIIA